MINTATKGLHMENVKDEQTVEYLTISQIASRLGVTPQAIYQRAQRGEFEVVAIGRALRVPKGDFERWLSDHTRPAKSSRQQ